MLRALPTELLSAFIFSCPGGSWTRDPLIKSQVLYHSATRHCFVIPVGLEPTTPALKVRCSKPTELRNQIPHFTSLTDWLPYGSGGLLLFQDSVEPTGYDPVPLDFQSSAMTTSATAPFCWVHEEFRNPGLWLHKPALCLWATHTIYVCPPAG